MALYIEPPTGNISLQKLETFALKRLDFISRIKEARGDVCRLQEIVCDDGAVADSDCLIAGSAKDKVSHFMLRLLLGGDPETHDFFCRAETSLFDFHFSCMSEEEMNKFFNKVNSQLHRKKLKPRQLTTPDSFESQDISCILGVFSNIRQSVGSWKKVIELYMAQCSNSYFSVPFQCILQLVSTRQVTLKGGMANVPFSKLRHVLREQFLSLMRLAAKQANRQHHSALVDDRLRGLWRKLKQMHRRRHPSAFGDNLLPGITLEQVDVLASKYPLCMSILLRSLRQKHRLGHHARIQLTLFLKDLGLPVHHAIALWQREYSQPPGTDCRCSHNWQTDGRSNASLDAVKREDAPSHTGMTQPCPRSCVPWLCKTATSHTFSP
ncbi:DNA primase large subunit-like isoform X3 [Littorina saxatilis]|uniref:DNA primase large subunit-like isoform X3 n=1 Tax=Littorina saxatilis TaxID=31220 RepID=UPI0038B4BEB8